MASLRKYHDDAQTIAALLAERDALIDANERTEGAFAIMRRMMGVQAEELRVALGAKAEAEQARAALVSDHDSLLRSHRDLLLEHDALVSAKQAAEMAAEERAALAADERAALAADGRAALAADGRAALAADGRAALAADERAALYAALAAIHRSTSWRVTAPLRFLATRLRRRR